MTQVILMIVIAATCAASGVDWIVNGNYSTAVAFFGFAVGYVGLAIRFAGV